MERFTKRAIDAVVYTGPDAQYPDTGDIAAELTTRAVRTILFQLAAYEDTGLTPEHVNEMRDDATAMVRELKKIKAELEAAKRDIAALLWLNGECEYCKYGRKEEYSGASRWTCTLGSRENCFPEWRGTKEE